MPTTINKQKILTQLFTALKKRYEPSEPEARPVLEQLLYGVCREGATREQADRAFQALRDRFFDWNEIRVSSPREVEDALGDIADAENRAQRLISILQEVFETTYSFDLESLQKKGMKQGAKQLARYQAANDYVIAWVVQQSLGGHAIPLDGPVMRCLRRLGLIDGDQENLEVLRASLEHLIPKVRGPLFNDLVSAVAEEFCHEDEPRCGTCPMAHDCPTGHEVTRAVAAGKGARPKPR